MTTIIVDIFNIIQKVGDTGIHLKVDVKPKSSRGPQKRPERHMGKKRTYTCHKATTRLFHNTSNSKSANDSLEKTCHDKAESTSSFGAATSANHNDRYA